MIFPRKLDLLRKKNTGTNNAFSNDPFRRERMEFRDFRFKKITKNKGLHINYIWNDRIFTKTHWIKLGGFKKNLSLFLQRGITWSDAVLHENLSTENNGETYLKILVFSRILVHHWRFPNSAKRGGGFRKSFHVLETWTKENKR